MKDFDYSKSAAYFVTICAHGQKCLFGEVVEFEMRLSAAGDMIQDVWNTLPDRYPEVELDAFIVMPNHVHGIIIVTEDPAVEPKDGTHHHLVGAGLVPAWDFVPVPLGFQACGSIATSTSRATTRVAPTGDEGLGATTRVAPTVGDRVGAFKSITTVEYVRGVKERGWPRFEKRIWQRNYHEHVIRNDHSFYRIRQYILDNPANWALDRENPDAQESAIPEEPWQC